MTGELAALIRVEDFRLAVTSKVSSNASTQKRLPKGKPIELWWQDEARIG